MQKVKIILTAILFLGFFVVDKVWAIGEPVVTIAPVAGSYTKHQGITLATTAGEIYYCRGVECVPDRLYTGTINVNANATIRYKGVDMGIESLISTADYVITGSEQAITFANGKWETTFNCNEWLWTPGANPNCDELHGEGGGTSAGIINETQITTAANYSGGLGGRGFRQWDADEHNIQSAPLFLNFKQPQKELWYRWYMRFENGYTRATGTRYHKIWYFRTDGSLSIAVIPEPYGDNGWSVVAQGAPDNHPIYTNNFGWVSLHGGETSDGSWHVYEAHMKMDSGSNDGEGHLWIDGILRAENHAVSFSNGNTQAQDGWSYSPFNNNHSANVNGREMYVDMDDIVIYNMTPPNLDAGGNAFIGPIGYGDFTAPSAPGGLAVQ